EGEGAGLVLPTDPVEVEDLRKLLLAPVGEPDGVRRTTPGGLHRSRSSLRREPDGPLGVSIAANVEIIKEGPRRAPNEYTIDKGSASDDHGAEHGASGQHRSLQP